MSERKNIKRNATRVSSSDRPFHQSMQTDYTRKRKDKELSKVQQKLL